MLVGATIFVQRITHIITTEIVVTNIRLIMKTGWIILLSEKVFLRLPSNIFVMR